MLTATERPPLMFVALGLATGSLLLAAGAFVWLGRGLSGLRGDVQAMKSDATSEGKETARAVAAAGQLAQKLEEAGKKAERLEAQVADLDRQLRDQNAAGRLATVESKLGGLSETQAALDKKVVALSAPPPGPSPADLSAKLALAEGRVAALEAKLDGLTGSQSALDKKVAGLQSGTDLAARVSQVESKLKGLAGDEADLDKKVAELEKDKDSDLATKLNKLDTKVNNLSTSLDNLEKRVSHIKKN
jgi:chromosome segregation ATPase